MAKGTEMDEFVVLSKVRTGLKREFAFALRSQNEISGSLGRTRARRPAEALSCKRIKKSGSGGGGDEEESEGDLKSDVVDAVSDEDVVESLRTETESAVVVAPIDVEMEDVVEKEEEIQDLPRKRFTRSSLSFGAEESKDLVIIGGGSSDVVKNVDNVSRKCVGKMIPSKLKDLLDTGLLEGLSVRYNRVKRKLATETSLQGVIRGSGILCNCEGCKGKDVVTPTVFEVHAGSSNKRPLDYIYLDNGRTFRDVLNACKESDLDNFEETIRSSIARAPDKKATYCCIDCNGSISASGRGRRRLRCDACVELKISKETPKKGTTACEMQPEQADHKSSESAKKSSVSGTKSQGRITRKDLRLHKLVFERDVLPNGTEVGYYVRGKKTLSGSKQKLGILCTCCQKEISPSQFEAHAGWASRRKPYLHIYTSNGVSLHELSVSLSRSTKFSTEENDDLCSICCQRGHLLCCDACPRSFHKECIPLLKVPDEKWYCRYCTDNFQKEKFAAHNANAIAAGRVAGIDPIEQIARRCIRIVKTQDQESDTGGCAICKAHDFAKGGFSRRTVMLCDQCEREFHVGCLQKGGQDLKELPEGKWFCCSGCSRINSALQQLIEDGDQQIPDDLLNLIKQKHAAAGHEDGNLDIKWRLLSGKMSAVDNTRALLSKAVSVFHEQFDPIVLHNSNQDMIPHMVYGRNVKDKEFGGMHCAVLTVNSIIVSVGIFRIFGKDIAELPLVATASGQEKLGYFQVLYSCIEKLLGELDVNYLWLPAADEAKPLWTNRFGFTDFPTDEFVELKKRFALMIFDGTSMLRKSVPKEHNGLDLHGGAMQAPDTLENHMDTTGMVSMDGAAKVIVSEDIGVTADISQVDETKAPVGSSGLGGQSSGALLVNATDAPKDEELGLSNDVSILASRSSLDGAQDSGELLDDTKEAPKGGDFGASSKDSAMQVLETSPDCGEIRSLNDDGEVQACGSPQEDGKQAVGANAMEVKVAVSKEKGALPDSEMEVVLD